MFDVSSEMCWMKDVCVRYLKNPNCECRESDVYCPKLQKLYNLYSNSGLTEKQREPVKLVCKTGTIDFDAYVRLREIEHNINQFVKNGGNIYIHSVISGNGKTSWAIKLLQAYFNSIWAEATSMECHGVFINVPKFLLDLKSCIGNPDDEIYKLQKNLLTAELVVWDEVATKAITEYEHEQLLSLINARLDSGKSNIYTSNLSKEELNLMMGQRLYSRIINESEDIVFNGADNRGKKDIVSDTTSSN